MAEVVVVVVGGGGLLQCPRNPALSQKMNEPFLEALILGIIAGSGHSSMMGT